MVGDYSQMLSSYHESLDIAEKAGNKRQIAKATSNIALFDEQREEYDQAQLLLEKVMNICLTERDSVLVLTVYIHLSGIAVEHRQYNLAQQYMQRALETAIAIRDEVQIATCRNELGKVLAAIGQSREAIALYEQCASILSAGAKSTGPGPDDRIARAGLAAAPKLSAGAPLRGQFVERRQGAEPETRDPGVGAGTGRCLRGHRR